ncbi:hypothetical protein [Methylobacter sp. YRD-M1]|uniref:hypothetical protein n=1 Tax=Methylobacter sp. YRD-M1 TaxID=2911520 RepID=UPI00227B5E1C|nr:hypothetical protein [Methylobacter sp. YRD-M1]WAK00443.1 hypothetical protein LZ558_11310 [Methylobacter sp. YRD-M1]
MKTIKIAIISALTIGFIARLWSNQPNSATEQAEGEFGATNSRVFASLHSDSASGSGVQKWIASNAAHPSNSSPFYILFTSNRLSLEASGSGPSYWTQQSGIMS